MKNKVFLSLGSNLGDRENFIKKATKYLKEILADFRISSIYETEPLYVIDQPSYLNCVVSGRTETDLYSFFRETSKIEILCGRNRKEEKHWGPRTLDIDILLFGDTVERGRELVIPHPRMKERLFVLVPLKEIEPDLRDPETGARYADLLDYMVIKGIYTYNPDDYNV